MLPALLTAIPSGSQKAAAVPVPSAQPGVPVPARVVTVYSRFGSVEYWNAVLVGLPSGLTVPRSVAVVAVTAEVPCVVAVGKAGAGRVTKLVAPGLPEEPPTLSATNVT